MLTIYRRHQHPCPHTARRFRKCACPIWVQGSLRGEYIRRSLDLRSWEAAPDLVRGWDASGEIGVVKIETPRIREAVSKFLEDAAARHLAPETVRKQRNLLEVRFVKWCERKGYALLKQINVDAIRQFRHTWNDSPNYAVKNLERLRAFFRFCSQADWITKNPAVGVKPPKVTNCPTLPFSDDEMRRLLKACDRYPGNVRRLRAFVLVMRYSGLRIGDALALSETSVSDNKILLYTQKTGVAVWVPVPRVVSDALAALDTYDSGRFFTTGNAKPQTARANWSRYLTTLFELANVSHGHSHRFRDTAAVNWLLAGAPLEDVSILLGHSSIRATERAYAPWVRARQERLEQNVRRSF